MGGQQFGDDCVLLDTRGLCRVRALDRERGLVTADAGVEWPELYGALHRWQPAHGPSWGIVQKQTGADRLTLGGALACNAHGRGLTLPPIVDQVESFDLVGADGEVRTCSRTQHVDLFRLAIGGYGLFGVMTQVRLRLRPRARVRRDVCLAPTGEVVGRLDERIRSGCVYGDFQFAIDESSADFLARGVLSCYQPVPDDVPLTSEPVGFSARDWSRLVLLAHTDKRRAFEEYARRYLETTGQIYWSDSQLSAAYADDYHREVDRACGARVAGSEMITEIFVARDRLASFMADAARMLRAMRASVIYGTVRLIEPDVETMLAWARDRYACIVFNLHVDHTAAEISRAAGAFRALIDLGIDHGGGYYLTYHRWARRDQVERAHPRLRDCLALKDLHDPDGVFQSTWYRHHRALLEA